MKRFKDLDIHENSDDDDDHMDLHDNKRKLESFNVKLETNV